MHGGTGRGGLHSRGANIYGLGEANDCIVEYVKHGWLLEFIFTRHQLQVFLGSVSEFGDELRCGVCPSGLGNKK